MFCSRCGELVSAEETICRHCGDRIPVLTPPAEARDQITSNYPYFIDKHAVLRAKYPELQGVHGWLAFYVFIRLVLSPIVFAASIYDGGSLNLYSIPDVLILAYGIYAALLILQKSASALTHVRIQLGVQIIVAIAAAVYVRSEDQRLANLVTYSVLWLLYFGYSKRVRLTLDPPPPKYLM